MRTINLFINRVCVARCIIAAMWTRRRFIFKVFVLTISLLICLAIFLSKFVYPVPKPSDTEISRYQERNITLNSSSKGTPILLWWSSIYSTIVDDVKTFGSVQCRVTNNRTLRNNPDTKVFIFYGSHFEPYDLPLPRHKNHLWALIHEESPRNVYILNHENTITLFNFTSTFQRRSNYPITTQWLKCPDWLWETTFMISLEEKNRLRNTEGLAPILYVHSDCHTPSDRDSFVTMLQKYIRVDSYGVCLNNKKLPENLRFRGSMLAMESDEFLKFVGRYKFSIAIENAVCDDYITEKLWRPLRVGSVPIVFGSPSVRDFLPSNHSAILVQDFRSVAELALYVEYLDTHDEKYDMYLRFKKRKIRNNFLQDILQKRDWHASKDCKTSRTKHNSFIFGFEEFVCREMHELERYASQAGSKIGKKIASLLHYSCPEPKRFDKLGRYTVRDKEWLQEWTDARYEAIVMWNLYSNNRTVQPDVFVQMVKSEKEKNTKIFTN
ncbi:hypothetical protein ACJMK2_035020 [Sinanodonta woodiana]|uniref:Fucosyltransferase n=1 Tax=Sinanodonta woodiana TaxID=1069815 RepID=A0ABD3WTL0_SINWO